jgi:hypothetical protein
MPIASPQYKFLRFTILGAPDDPGVYALWQDAEIIYFGSAARGEATIQSRLLEHFSRQRDPSSEATHYSWEVCKDIPTRLAELLREHEANFRRLPRYNHNFGSGGKRVP